MPRVHRPKFGFSFLMFVAASVCAAQPSSGLRTPPALNVPQAMQEARERVADLLSRAPEASIRTNLLRVRPPGGQERTIPVRFEIVADREKWTTVYETLGGLQPGQKLVVSSRAGGPNTYTLATSGTNSVKIAGNQTMVPFAGSDFWVVDLGLEFLHWPTQLILKKELRKGQACQVLESTNPTPASGAYSRVVSWVDTDTGGIVHADAYDNAGRILKQFDPSELQKVNGQLQVKEIEMRNRQTYSRSWVSFDLR